MLRLFTALSLLTALGASGDALYDARTASANAVVSRVDPAVRIAVPQTARYVGTDAWTLYGIADCQIFVFADAGPDKNVTRLYWVQFEAYVPSMPKLKHDYDSPHHTDIAGWDFFVDTWVQSSKPSQPHVKEMAAALKSLGYEVPAGLNSGSDYQHVVGLLHAGGYALSPRMSSIRLVHLLDPETRKELMIIYSVPADAAQQNDDALRQRLLAEARARIEIDPAFKTP